MAALAILGRPIPPHTYDPVGTIWPHGEFSLGYKKVWPEGYDPTARHKPEMSGQQESAVDAGGDSPLDLTSAPNSRTAAKRGGKGITAFGKKMLRSAAAIAERKYAPRAFTFLTITYPQLTRADRLTLVNDWPEFVNRLQEWIGRAQQRAGVQRWIFSATEVQTRRFDRTGEAYLHLHMAYPNYEGRTGPWLKTPDEIRAWVRSFWECRIPSLGGQHLNIDVKPVRKSVGRYLSKYLSKGICGGPELVSDWGEGVHPSTWWNVTASLKNEVKRAKKKGVQVGKWLERLIQLVIESGKNELVAYMKHCELEWQGYQLNVGWVGALSPPLLGEVYRGV